MDAQIRKGQTRTRPTDIYAENVRRTPIGHARTVRPDDVSVATTSKAGKFTPVAMIPLLREDSVLSSTMNVNFQMAETANMLLNPVRATAVAYLVPKLAFDRFPDQGTIDRSYNGQQEIDGTVVPWFEEFTGPSPSEIMQTLGLHDTTFNTEYIEAYNQVWNFIATQRSPALTPRNRLDGSLAPGFWQHNQMKHVKATFDDALLEGEVPLTVTDGAHLPIASVNGFGAMPDAATLSPVDLTSNSRPPNEVGDPQTDQIYANLSAIASELQNGGITVSLANINLARETAAWARLRTQFQGLSEDWMIDQLLAGVRMPYQALMHPILLDQQDTVIGMTTRYATDSGNLDQTATEGQTAVQLRLNVPQVSTGGVIVVCAQCLPEMLYERQRDYFSAALTVDDLPNRTADELDPQPVATIKNGEIDTKHTVPDALFGYAPLNHEWQRNSPRLGGKYYRVNPDDPWTEDRNRVWDTSVIDPQLGTDFYTATTVTQDVFLDTTADTFEYWASGRVNISGLTYFGPALRESQDDYDKVLAQVDQSRIKGDGTDPAADVSNRPGGSEVTE